MNQKTLSESLVKRYGEVDSRDSNCRYCSKRAVGLIHRCPDYGMEIVSRYEKKVCGHCRGCGFENPAASDESCGSCEGFGIEKVASEK